MKNKFIAIALISTFVLVGCSEKEKKEVKIEKNEVYSDEKNLTKIKVNKEEIEKKENGLYKFNFEIENKNEKTLKKLKYEVNIYDEEGNKIKDDGIIGYFIIEKQLKKNEKETIKKDDIELNYKGEISKVELEIKEVTFGEYVQYFKISNEELKKDGYYLFSLELENLTDVSYHPSFVYEILNKKGEVIYEGSTMRIDSIEGKEKKKFEFIDIFPTENTEEIDSVRIVEVLK